ncbi:MAG: DUF4147 domain-containing protein [Planctomycetota bacterium]
MNQTTIESDLKSIWQAGVDSVKPRNLIRNRLRIDANSICFGSESSGFERLIDFDGDQKLWVVGAGKASAAMAISLDREILQTFTRQRPNLTVGGWINCPEQAGLPESTDSGIKLFQARPAGMNAPTEKAIEGTRRILSLIENADPNDIVISLISGGGSALLTAPAEGLTLDDKQLVAKRLAAAGANIEQLNCVRRAISRVKGGGLARQCRAGRLAAIMISDVLGDSLETIASGPTYLPSSVSSSDALDVLTKLGLDQDAPLRPVVNFLKSATVKQTAERSVSLSEAELSGPHITHSILGNNAEAVERARLEAIARGYDCVTSCAEQCEGDVTTLADETVAALRGNLSAQKPTCLITGGEPTVTLPPSPGKGGRNQQLTGEVLIRIRSALNTLTDADEKDTFPLAGSHSAPFASGQTIGFLSGGTDGEDGPTDAAGAYFCDTLGGLRQMPTGGLDDLRRSLSKADTYDFFDRAGYLLKSGPTGTNVCDLRVTLIVPPHGGVG